MHLPDTITKRLNLMYGQPVDPRPTWDEYFMRDAIHVASRSTCPRARVGCVVVIDNHRLVSGYNGSAKGQPHCTDVGCLMDGGHCVRACHAEQNALSIAAKRGISINGATIYVTHQPCTTCSNMLINAGIKRVVYLNEYAPADKGLFLRMAGVSVERIEL